MIIKERKKSALNDYNKNREKTKSLKDIIDKLTKLKIPNEIFIEWKNKRNLKNIIDYETFIKKIGYSIKEKTKMKTGINYSFLEI